MEDKIKLTSELEEMLQLIEEIIPSKNGKKFSKEELLKLVFSTFIALITQEENNNKTE